MNWRAILIRDLATMSGLVLILTVLVLVLLWRVLPAPVDRRRLRWPARLLVLHLLVVGARAALEPHRDLAGPAGLLALALLLIAFARAGFLLIVDWFVGRRLGRPMPRIFRDIIQGIVFLVASLFVLRTVGVELGSLLTTSAILTAVLGLSLQESLGNLFAGLAVHTERPFEVGDWVQFGDTNPIVGQVLEINWRATKLRTKDSVEVIVPNGIIARLTIQNLHRPSPVMRRVVRFQGPYSEPPNRVRAALQDALRGCPGVLPEPHPKIWTAGFADSGIDYAIAFYLDRFDVSQDIESDVRDRIWYALARADIDIPYPVRELRRPRPAASASQDRFQDPAERMRVLVKIDLFNLLPEEALGHVARAARCQRFAGGESIVFEGDRGDELFVVLEGEVAVVTQAAGRGTEVLARLGPQSLFGELSLLSGVRGATVRAVSDALVLGIRHSDFRAAVDEVAGLHDALMTRLMERRPPPPQQAAAGSEAATSESSVSEALFDRIVRFFARNN